MDMAEHLRRPEPELPIRVERWNRSGCCGNQPHRGSGRFDCLSERYGVWRLSFPDAKCREWRFHSDHWNSRGDGCLLPDALHNFERLPLRSANNNQHSCQRQHRCTRTQYFGYPYYSGSQPGAASGDYRFDRYRHIRVRRDKCRSRYAPGAAIVTGINLVSNLSNVTWTSYPTPPVPLQLNVQLFEQGGNAQYFVVTAQDSTTTPASPAWNTDLGFYVSGVDNLQMDNQTDSTGHAMFLYQHTNPGIFNISVVDSTGRSVTVNQLSQGTWTPPTASGSGSNDTVSVSVSAPGTVVASAPLALTATVTDISGFTPTVQWSQVSGPGDVTFGNAQRQRPRNPIRLRCA